MSVVSKGLRFKPIDMCHVITVEFQPPLKGHFSSSNRRPVGVRRGGSVNPWILFDYFSFKRVQYIPYVRHYCPLSNYKPHPPKNKLILIFYCIFELKFPHKKSKKQIEAADNRAAGTVHIFRLETLYVLLLAYFCSIQAWLFVALRLNLRMPK